MTGAKRLTGILLVAVALAAGWQLYSRVLAPEMPSEAAQATRYHCPMHPAMLSDHPGDCPICGMRMVPIEEDDKEAAGDTRETGDPSSPASDRSQTSRPAAGAKKVIYRSTMNPGEISDRPGKDSMGMEMAPEELDEAPAAGAAAVEGRAAVKLPAQRRQLIGVRTAPVEKAPLVREIRTVGRVTYDETLHRSVYAKTAGWVEQLYANTTGQLVREGEPLLSIYSPELVASAQEYILARRGRDQLAASEMAGDSGERLVASARQRLLLFDLSPEQIAELERSGKAPKSMILYAPISGHIITRNVTQGDRIEPGTQLLDIAELSRVWVLADIYEYEMPFVQLGHAATMTLSYVPDRKFEGRISLIYPVLSESTRTVKVRLEFANPDLALKPGMYAQVEIRSDLGERLVVPDSAVISSGTRDLAFVDRGDGYLEPRQLELGTRLSDSSEVISGLAEGERVVVSGNFLVDSESKLKAALAEASSKTGAESGHAH